MKCGSTALYNGSASNTERMVEKHNEFNKWVKGILNESIPCINIKNYTRVVDPDWHIFWAFQPSSRIDIAEPFIIKIYRKDIISTNLEVSKEILFRPDGLTTIQIIDEIICEIETIFEIHNANNLQKILNLILNQMFDRYQEYYNMLEIAKRIGAICMYIMDFTMPDPSLELREFIFSHPDLYSLTHCSYQHNHPNHNFRTFHYLALTFKRQQEGIADN